MEDTLLVRVLNSIGYYGDEFRCFLCGEWAIACTLREIRTFDQIHREIVLPLLLADFVDGDDVRMFEPRRRRRFRTKPFHVFRPSERAITHQLYRDYAVEAGLPRAEDDAHPAAGDLFQQFVVADAAKDPCLR